MKVTNKINSSLLIKLISYIEHLKYFFINYKMTQGINFNSKLVPKSLLLCLFLITASSQLPQISGLYIDRINIWDAMGSVQGPIDGGYNFTLTWRQTLPTIISTSMGLYNFVNGPNGILSFQTSIYSTTNTSTIININPVGSQAFLVYLAFSVIVITQQSQYVEVLTCQRLSLTVSESKNYSATLSSTKFNLSQNGHHRIQLFQWIKGDMEYYVSSYNYWSTLNVTEMFSSNQITLSFYVGSLVYMTGFKVNVILLAKDMGGETMIRHYSTTQFKQSFPIKFTYNLGIDSQLYSPQFQYCVHGLTSLDLYVHRSPSTLYSSALFVYNNVSEVIEFSNSAIYGAIIETNCFAKCPTSYIFNNQCMNCRSTIPFCLQCSSDIICKTCRNGFTLSTDNSSCDCLVRQFGNRTSLKCQACPYDCYTCDNLGNCLTCNITVDFREKLDNRCIPIVGHYENHQTICPSCPIQCSQCISASQCTLCAFGYSLSGVICSKVETNIKVQKNDSKQEPKQQETIMGKIVSAFIVFVKGV